MEYIVQYSAPTNPPRNWIWRKCDKYWRPWVGPPTTVTLRSPHRIESMTTAMHAESYCGAPQGMESIGDAMSV